MENQIVWQPSSLYPSDESFGIKNYGFQIDLNWDFAKKMIETKVSEEKINNLNKLAKNRFDMLSSNSFQFYEDTAFVNMIRLGINGRWLNTNRYMVASLLENKNEGNIEYHTHNIDCSPDAHTLLGLFDFWIYYSSALIE